MNNYEEKHVHITKTPCYVNKEVKREESKEHQISIIWKYLNWHSVKHAN